MKLDLSFDCFAIGRLTDGGEIVYRGVVGVVADGRGINGSEAVDRGAIGWIRGATLCILTGCGGTFGRVADWGRAIGSVANGGGATGSVAGGW